MDQPQPANLSLDKLSRILSELMDKQVSISAAKKGITNALKEAQDPELKARLKDLKGARKKLSQDVKELQEELERATLAANPEIKDFRENVLTLEEQAADLKVEVRALAAPLLEKKELIEFEIRTGDVPAKVQLLRSVIASINGREQKL